MRPSSVTPSRKKKTPILSGETPDGHPVFVFAGIEFVRVPKGSFLMGSPKEDPDAFPDEHPQHKVDIPYDYFIGRFTITCSQFSQFPGALDLKFLPENKDNPVQDVHWDSVQEYLGWLNRKFRASLPSAFLLRLPSEAEWEKAARGTDGRIYPWGDTFEKERCNSSESINKSTLPVGSYSPVGDSPYGAADMAGNVREWTATLYRPYPYNPADGREDLTVQGNRVSRGGSFFDYRKSVRAAFRSANSFTLFRGFRLVLGPRLFTGIG